MKGGEGAYRAPVWVLKRPVFCRIVWGVKRDAIGVEFRLGRGDHLVVESFLSTNPAGVAGVLIDAPNIERQAPAVEAASHAGIDVVVEPLTERLAEDGFRPIGLKYADQYPLDQSSLRGEKAVGQFVERVLDPQLDVATILTPPHFFADSPEALHLNVAMAELVVERYGHDLPVRPILAAQRSFLADPETRRDVIEDYWSAGVRRIDLRLSPVGADGDGPIKIRSALEIAADFSSRGIEVSLGFQGSLGPTALALGFASRFSTGVGYREQFNHAAAISRQRQVRPKDPKKGPRGPVAGVHLPRANATVTRRVAKHLYEDEQIRSKIACRIGDCAKSIDQPVLKPRPHYLHSRAKVVEDMIERPAAWRPKLEKDRLDRAIELRGMLNAHLPLGVPELRTRLLESLSAEIGNMMEIQAQKRGA